MTIDIIIDIIRDDETLCSGDPRVNIQNTKGMAKAYQVRQVLKAIEKLESEK